jgi:hypothetical protein
VIEKAALKHGLTLSTARWIEELAKELGVKEKRLLKAVVKLAKHGIWLEAEDWRLVARTIDMKYLDMARGLRHKTRGLRRLPRRGGEGAPRRRRKSRQASPHKRSLEQLVLTQFKTASELVARPEADTQFKTAYFDAV